MTTEDHSLRIHEWLAVAVMGVGIALIGLLTWTPSFDDALEPVKAGFVSVEVEGCVHHPGTYELPIGSKVQDVLALAEPLPEATFKGIRRNALLKNGQLIRVKEQSKITIHLEGAVQTPGPLEVRRGCRMVDLIDIAPLTHEADHTFLQRKRRLKDGEHIVIPAMECDSSHTRP